MTAPVGRLLLLSKEMTLEQVRQIRPEQMPGADIFKWFVAMEYEVGADIDAKHLAFECAYLSLFDTVRHGEEWA